MAKKKAAAKKPAQVDAIRHHDKRKNIPTEELRDFVAEQEQTPQTLLYARDTSLDPQLVWKGKDEQDRQDLAVPVVPIYIQEKIKPQAIIDDLLAEHGERHADPQLGLFADFNGLPEEFDKRVDFYRYDGHWQNRMILGDSLLVMASLAEKEGLKGQVQTIYFDPPYGIKFGSNWQVSTRRRDVKDGKAEDSTRQPEQVRAFRDTWKLGVHSYLAYLRDRLVVARELLADAGSIFVQIGDENVHLVRGVLDEVFGAANTCAHILFKKTGASTDDLLPSGQDHLLWFAKNREQVKYRQLYRERTLGSEGTDEYMFVEERDGTTRNATAEELAGVVSLPANARSFRYTTQTSSHHYALGTQPYVFAGRSFSPGNRYWSTHPEGMKKCELAGRFVARRNELSYKRYLDDFPVLPLTTSWQDTMMSSRAEMKVYVVQSSAKVISRSLLMTSDPGDLVLDPTCGSGTTAYVAEQWGRRWITIDTSRVALALARTRLMAARYPYYLLADSPDGIQKETELTGKAPPPYATAGDIRKGFVYKRVPHVTLKSIANNPDIREGMTRVEIDAAIARHAETETLFDQPYEDNKRVRVSGPFTVESLSPHRVLATDDDRPAAGTEGHRDAADFAGMILDNLRAAGVQNTIKNERLKFDKLEPFAGRHLHAKGEYTEADGKVRRVAVSLGPEHGTVGPQQVKEAAKEAVLGIGFDLLIVCGFAFDPHVSEEAKRFGALTVLPVRMNPDLGMSDELLKKTGAANLFMVFGEPDVEISESDGRLTVEIKGLDVYDPTTGAIRSHSTDDIACWFIDTNYNGESFFVRHAYFTGADEPYDKLKRALRAEIDEAAWSALYSTTSRPFPKPDTGRIALKVINHYGDEVLRVFDIATDGRTAKQPNQTGRLKVDLSGDRRRNLPSSLESKKPDTKRGAIGEED